MNYIAHFNRGSLVQCWSTPSWTCSKKVTRPDGDLQSLLSEKMYIQWLCKCHQCKMLSVWNHWGPSIWIRCCLSKQCTWLAVTCKSCPQLRPEFTSRRRIRKNLTCMWREWIPTFDEQREYCCLVRGMLKLWIYLKIASYSQSDDGLTVPWSCDEAPQERECVWFLVVCVCLYITQLLIIRDIVIVEAFMGCCSPSGAVVTLLICEISVVVVDRAKECFDKLVII